MDKKFRSTEEFIAAARSVHGNKYLYVGAEYVNMREKLLITCPEHGEFRQTPYQHIRGQGCKKCACAAHGASHRLDPQEYLARVAEIHNGRYDLSRVQFTRLKDKIEVVCREHGSFFPSASNFLTHKSNCPKCKYEQQSAASRLSFDQYVARFREKEVHGGTYEYRRVFYEGGQAVVEAVCASHGAFTQLVQDHLRGCGCVKCARPIHDTQSFIDEATKVHGSRYDYSGSEYINALHYVKIRCKEHGEFEQKAACHVHTRQGCPVCGGTGPSRGQQEINAFLSQYVETKMEHKVGVRRRLDILIPSLNIGVEYHGLIWHSTKFHTDPLNLCHKHFAASKEGLRTIHIFQDEWEDPIRQGAVKNLLTALVGAAPRYAARKCSLVEVNDKDAEAFINRCHIQGYATNTLTYGLVGPGGELRAAMSFSGTTSDRTRSRSPSVWELRRYCSDGVVVGGASKLFKHFLRTHNPMEIVSYSDSRLFAGDVYELLGFYVESMVRPTYYYVTPGVVKRFNKSRFQLKYLPKLLGEGFDPSLTEAENCAKNNWFQLYDCGKARWVWRKSKW